MANALAVAIRRHSLAASALLLVFAVSGAPDLRRPTAAERELPPWPPPPTPPLVDGGAVATPPSPPADLAAAGAADALPSRRDARPARRRLQTQTLTGYRALGLDEDWTNGTEYAPPGLNPRFMDCASSAERAFEPHCEQSRLELK